MTKRFQAVLKYEFINLARSRWIFAYALVVFGLGYAFLYISGDEKKSLLSLNSVLILLTPLMAILYSAITCYYSDRFTATLMTQPIGRGSLYWARLIALASSLVGALVLGVGGAFLFHGLWSIDVFLSLSVLTVLTIVFVACGVFISNFAHDRMKGLGLVLVIWIYFALIHDGLLLVLLVSLRDYPLDGVAMTLGFSNPLSLSRILVLSHFDAPLLLGHVGALVRKVLTSGLGYQFALLSVAVWLIFPSYLGMRFFRKRDF